MRIHLSGWQRIGIVLSVVWAIGGGIWGNSIGIHDGDWVVATYESCLKSQPDWDRCQAQFDKSYPAAIANHWRYAAVFGLVPIPLGWLVVYGLIGLWRWIKRGFKT